MTDTERMTLPSGGWAELRDPETLRGRDKQRVMRNVKGKPDNDNPVPQSLDIAEGLACMMIAAWEVPYLPGAALPCDDPELLGELKIRDYDAIMFAVKPAQELLFPDAVTPDDHDKPGSPTPPAGA